MARKLKPVKPVPRQQLFDKINEQHREINELKHANVQATTRHEEAERGLRTARDRANLAERRIDKLYATPVPQSTRRVVRTLVIEGDPVWVAQTLATSLQDGRTAIGLLPGGGVRNAITCVTTEDVTTRQDQLRAPDRLRQHDGPGTGGHVRNEYAVNG